MKEAEIIARFFAPHAGSGAMGLLDDGAILPPLPRGCRYGVSCDSVIEGVHTLSDTSPEDWAGKVLAVNLSDLAAMAAEPLGVVLSLALPPLRVQEFCASFARAVARECSRYKLSWLGGDLNRIEGPICITATVFGAIDPKHHPLRSQARPGDSLFVTGCLGESALGLRILKGEIGAEDSAYVRRVVRRYRCPEARVRAGLRMRPFARAAMDLSDGLATDLENFCRACSLGAEVDLSLLPIASDMRALLGEQQALRLAVGGGEDFELLMALPKERAQGLRTALAPLEVCEIGRLTEKKGIRYRGAEQLGEDWQQTPLAQGYSHFL